MPRFTDLPLDTAEAALKASGAEAIIHNDKDLIAVKLGKLRICGTKNGTLVVSQEG